MACRSETQKQSHWLELRQKDRRDVGTASFTVAFEDVSLICTSTKGQTLEADDGGLVVDGQRLTGRSEH